MAPHDAAFGFRVRNTTYREAVEVSDAVATAPFTGEQVREEPVPYQVRETA
jgi:hypothetical protein